MASALGIASEPVENSSSLRWPVLRDRLCTALAGIHSAPLLASFSFDIDPTADAAEISRVKRAYLDSIDFSRQQWGGSREMYLLSHFHSGQLAFRTFDSVHSSKGSSQDAWRFLCAPTPAAAAAITPDTARKPFDLSESACKPKREIALHHCAYRGGNRANHYERISYLLTNGECISEWRNHSPESAEERGRRFRLIQSRCMQARLRTISAAALEEQRNALAAAALLKQSALYSRHSSPAKRAISSAKSPVAARACSPSGSNTPLQRRLFAPPNLPCDVSRSEQIQLRLQ